MTSLHYCDIILDHIIIIIVIVVDYRILNSLHILYYITYCYIIIITIIICYRYAYLYARAGGRQIESIKTIIDRPRATVVAFRF